MESSLPRARVLVADGEVGMRKALAAVMESAPDIDFLGTASLSSTLLVKVESLGPDWLIVGLDFPDGGPKLLRHLRQSFPGLHIVVLGDRETVGSSGEQATWGGVGFVPRPTGTLEHVVGKLNEYLLPRIRVLGAASLQPGPGPPLLSKPATPVHSFPAASPGSPRVVVIASSTGGPRALDAVLPLLPVLPVPILIVQHMPAEFTRMLAERLTSLCSFPVREARDGEILSAGCAWVAPGGLHLSVVKQGRQYATSVHHGPLENSCRPAADVLFRSAVAAWGGDVLGVVLTGMGQDGLRGAKEIVQAGGTVIVQDEATSVVWGMPGFIAQAGLASAVLPLPRIAQAIVKRVTPDPTVASPRVGAVK